jgi:hypothetical protein
MTFADGVVTVSTGAAASLQKKRLARRIFENQEPTVWQIIHTPVVLEVTDAGRAAYAAQAASGDR